MKNILKTTALLFLMATTMGCATALKKISNEFRLSIKANESFVVGDVQGDAVLKSPPSNYNPDVDYLGQNESIQIQNESDKELTLKSKTATQSIEAKKTITIVLTKGSVFTIDNPYNEAVNILIKSPLTYNFKYQIKPRN